MNSRPQSRPTVVLSGPTGGLGRALFDQLVSQSYPVIGLGRDLTRITTQATTLVPANLIEVDLGNANALPNALATLRDIVQPVAGPLVFISNAGTIEPIGQAIGLVPSDLERALHINCLAPLMIAHTMTSIAEAQSRPLLILNVSTGAAERPIRGWQPYCTSKAAYKMALDVLAAENPTIRILHFDPGVMDTPMQELIRRQHAANMPEVAAFRAYQTEGVLKKPRIVADELILLMEHHLP